MYRIISSSSIALSFLSVSYQGYIGAYLVLGGVDSTGPHLFTVHAHGSTDKLPYVSMGKFLEVGVVTDCFNFFFFPFKGSGSLAAMAVFEDGFKPNMEVCGTFFFCILFCSYYLHSFCDSLTKLRNWSERPLEVEFLMIW